MEQYQSGVMGPRINVFLTSETRATVVLPACLTCGFYVVKDVDRMLLERWLIDGEYLQDAFVNESDGWRMEISTGIHDVCLGAESALPGYVQRVDPVEPVHGEDPREKISDMEDAVGPLNSEEEA